MTGRFKKYHFLKPQSKHENGSVMLEFAFVFPILVIFALSGYNLMRDMEVNMIKRDFSRSLIMSYQCTFKQSNAAKYQCYSDAVANLTNYAKEKSILKKYIPAVAATTGNTGTPARVEPGNFAYTIQTYSITDIIKKIPADQPNGGATDPSFPINEARKEGCASSTDTRILDAEISYEGGYLLIPPNYGFRAKYSNWAVNNYAKGQLDKDATEAEKKAVKIKIKDLFPGDDEITLQARRNLCLNGSITIAEVNFRLDKFFKFGRLPNSPNVYYEVSFL